MVQEARGGLLIFAGSAALAAGLWVVLGWGGGLAGIGIGAIAIGATEHAAAMANAISISVVTAISDLGRSQG